MTSYQIAVRLLCTVDIILVPHKRNVDVVSIRTAHQK